MSADHKPAMSTSQARERRSRELWSFLTEWGKQHMPERVEFQPQGR